jgi:hypothetical protein
MKQSLVNTRRPQSLWQRTHAKVASGCQFPKDECDFLDKEETAFVQCARHDNL